MRLRKVRVNLVRHRMGAATRVKNQFSGILKTLYSDEADKQEMLNTAFKKRHFSVFIQPYIASHIVSLVATHFLYLKLLLTPSCRTFASDWRLTHPSSAQVKVRHK